MKPSFSEFSFGFAYTFEVATARKRNLIQSPRLPSLAEEGGEEGVGYDVRLDRVGGFIYCAQFKLSEYMKKSNAREAGRGYPLPYYRFAIYGKKKSEQHGLLCDLEMLYNTRVEYVAPRFYLQKTLDSCFKTRTLRNRVQRIKPSMIGELPDRNNHNFVFNKDGTGEVLFSDPIKIGSPSNWGEITEHGFEPPHHAEEAQEPELDEVEGLILKEPPVHTLTSSTEARMSIEAQLTHFTEQVIRVLEGPRNYFDELDLDPVGKAQAVARILLGAELLVFSEER